MKTLNVFSILILMMSLSACDPGLTEYGYLYNPKGILVKLFNALKNNDFEGDWILLFDSKLICTYTSEEGIESLKKTFGNLDEVQKEFRLESPVRIPSSPDLEQYRARVIRNKTGQISFTFIIGCHHEQSKGSMAHYCTIEKLIYHEHPEPKPAICQP